MRKFTLFIHVALVLVFLAAPVHRVWAGEIHEAVKAGDIEKVRLLLDGNPDLLYVFCDQGKTPVHWATGRGQLEILQMLLTDYKANPNCRNINGGTPLHVSASQAQPEAMKILIKHGAAINDPRKKDDATPLHIAALKGQKEGHIEAARILLEHGGDMNAKMENGATPWSLASFRGNTEVLELFERHRTRSTGGTETPAGSGSRRPGWGRQAGSGQTSRGGKQDIRQWMQQQRAGDGGQKGSGNRKFDRSRMMQRFDLDGDGVLNDNERAQMRDQIRQRMSGASGSQTPPSSMGQTGMSEKGQQMFRNIAEKMGRPLTNQERADIGKVFQENIQTMGKSKETFAITVSELTGVPVEQLREWIPPPWGLNQNYQKDLIPRIEEYRRSKITEEELEIIKAAGQKKNEVLYAGKDAIVDTLSRITGVPTEDIDDLMPKYGKE